jgi:dihydroorotate dehydrogenase
MLYSLIRPLLFRMDPETAHHATLDFIRLLNEYGLDTLLLKPRANLPVEVMGLMFPNPIGLAAGVDKNGDYLDALAALGFGFVEIGTITPLPQPGNPKPRMFRFPDAEAIINRMGFNNEGVDALVENIKRSRFQGVLGINIGKNAITPIERAVDDYLTCLNKVYPYASYVTVNISSPNTKNLRDLQSAEALAQLLGRLKMRQIELAQQHGRYVPLVVKIAPDLDLTAIAEIAQVLVTKAIDGVIATNTTLSRDGVLHIPEASQDGGLSGAPLHSKSTLVIRELAMQLDGALPIIGVGGITHGGDAWEKFNAGASLVQLYSGLVFRGPRLVHEAVEAARPYFAARAAHAEMIRHAPPANQGEGGVEGQTDPAVMAAALATVAAHAAATGEGIAPPVVETPVEGDAAAPAAVDPAMQPPAPVAETEQAPAPEPITSDAMLKTLMTAPVGTELTLAELSTTRKLQATIPSNLAPTMEASLPPQS